MDKKSYCIPVVAHRLFGRKPFAGDYLDSRVQARGALGEPFQVGGAQLRPWVTSKLDSSQGTQRSLKEVIALFRGDRERDESGDGSVNDFWTESGIRFELVATIDHSVSTALANFLPSEARTFNELASDFNVPRALNVYFVRDIEGAWGVGYPVQPDEPSAAVGYAFVSDRFEMDAVDGPEARWRADLITTAHELGHCLNLGHRQEVENLMFGFGTRDGSVELLPSQTSMAHYLARNYRSAIYVDEEVPHFLEPDSSERLLFF